VVAQSECTVTVVGARGYGVEELVLLTLYAKSKTDNLTGPVLKEIRRALED
jgi:hypothetical protein